MAEEAEASLTQRIEFEDTERIMRTASLVRLMEEAAKYLHICL